jgi:hypothetical protein
MSTPLKYSTETFTVRVRTEDIDKLKKQFRIISAVWRVPGGEALKRLIEEQFSKIKL